LPTIFCKGGLALDIKDCDEATCCQKRATCTDFKGCSGKDEHGEKILGNAGEAVLCSGLADSCNIATCCVVEPVEDTCFPGEAEVAIQDGHGLRVDDIETGITVFSEGGFEPVIGMLHLHSEASPTLAHVTAVSV